MENNLLVYRTISHFINLIVIPEIDNRLKNGVITENDLPLEVSQFQIVWDNSNNKIIVELNREVKIKVKLKGRREIKVGEAVTVNDIYPDECYIINSIIDGKTCSFYICKSLYLGFTTYFDFLPNDPNYDEERFKNLNLKYNILDFDNSIKYKKLIKPYEKLIELANKNWPPAPNLYPKILKDYYNDPEIINNKQIIDKILEVYSLDFWNKHIDFWETCKFFPSRLIYIKRAVDAFYKDDFISAIYILVPQFEGIIKEYLITSGVISNWNEYFRVCVDALRDLLYSKKLLMFPQKILDIIFNYLKTGSFWINTSNISDPKTQINRHGILHGIYTGFESKEIALKYLLLLDSLFLILLHDKMINLTL